MSSDNNYHRVSSSYRDRSPGDRHYHSYRGSRRSMSRSPPPARAAAGPPRTGGSREDRWSSSGSSSSSTTYRRTSRSRSRDRRRDRRDRSRSRGRTGREYSPERSLFNRGDRHQQRVMPASTSAGQEPQIEVILNNLPLFCHEDDIMDAIRQYSTFIDHVRIARDKSTGESKGFGFVRFATIKDAEDFMRRTYSALTVGNAQVRVSYSHNPRGTNNGMARVCTACRAQNDQHSQACWQCHSSMQDGLAYREDYQEPGQQQQQLQGPRKTRPLTSHNDGSRDIGQMPSSLLVAIDLPTTTTEAALWESFCELGGAHLLPLRILLVRDRRSRLSCGYAFIEYPSIEGATTVLERAGATFKVQTKTAGLYFAHHDSFYPAFEGAQWTVPLGKEGLPMIYWDEQVFMTPFSAAEYGVTLIDAQAYMSMADTTVRTEQQQQAQPQQHPPVQQLPTVLTTAKVDKAHLEGIAAVQAAEQLAKAEERRRKKEAAAGTKKISIQLQKWNTKQMELKRDQGNTPATSGTVHPIPAQSHHEPEYNENTSSETPSAASATTTTTSVIAIDMDNYDPAELEDLELMACMLCQRRFKGVPELRKHQELSDLHKKNLQDKDAMRTALTKTRTKRGVDLATGAPSRTLDQGEEGTTAVSEGRNEPRYRDRAAERRMVYGQPDNPIPPSRRHHGAHIVNNGKGFGTPSASLGIAAIVPEQPTKDGIKEDNVGNRLLKSMGWKEGQGLGKDGGGITAPVEATSYSRGAGIGAGVLFKGDQHTRGYAETAKEIARRRYDEERQ